METAGSDHGPKPVRHLLVDHSNFHHRVALLQPDPSVRSGRRRNSKEHRMNPRINVFQLSMQTRDGQQR